MEEKEASGTSNCSSPDRKLFVLGVVNASEIKCKVDRKRRWDQPPNDSKHDGSPPSKLHCDDTSDIKDCSLENNISHDDENLQNSNVLEGIPLPPLDNQLSERLAPLPLPEPLVIKEQIVQTPSEVINNIDMNSSYPPTISSSFNELNYTEGNRRVTIEIETVEVTPSALDDEPKTSVEVVNPNSATVDSLSSKENNPVKIDDANFDRSKVREIPSPDSEVGDTMDRESFDVESSGNVDPDVMEVILGISPNKTTKSPQEIPQTTESLAKVEESSKNVSSVQLNENLISEKQKLTEHKLSDEKKATLESKEESSACIKSEHPVLKTVSQVKSLVDYDDYSDESSQQSDKIPTVEPGVKISVGEVTTPCENSLDSKEEEFHDCLEQHTTDESNCDSSSLSNLVLAPFVGETDDLINNNPLDSGGVNCSSITATNPNQSVVDNAVETKPGIVDVPKTVIGAKSNIDDNSSSKNVSDSTVFIEESKETPKSFDKSERIFTKDNVVTSGISSIAAAQTLEAISKTDSNLPHEDVARSFPVTLSDHAVSQNESLEKMIHKSTSHLGSYSEDSVTSDEIGTIHKEESDQPKSVILLNETCENVEETKTNKSIGENVELEQKNVVLGKFEVEKVSDDLRPDVPAQKEDNIPSKCQVVEQCISEEKSVCTDEIEVHNVPVLGDDLKPVELSEFQESVVKAVSQVSSVIHEPVLGDDLKPVELSEFQESVAKAVSQVSSVIHEPINKEGSGNTLSNINIKTVDSTVTSDGQLTFDFKLQDVTASTSNRDNKTVETVEQSTCDIELPDITISSTNADVKTVESAVTLKASSTSDNGLQNVTAFANSEILESQTAKHSGNETLQSRDGLSSVEANSSNDVGKDDIRSVNLVAVDIKNIFNTNEEKNDNESVSCEHSVDSVKRLQNKDFKLDVSTISSDNPLNEELIEPDKPVTTQDSATIEGGMSSLEAKNICESLETVKVADDNQLVTVIKVGVDDMLITDVDCISQEPDKLKEPTVGSTSSDTNELHKEVGNDGKIEVPVVQTTQMKPSSPDNNFKRIEEEFVPNMKTSGKDAVESPLVTVSENNSILSSADLNMECESVDTLHSVESVLSQNELLSSVDKQNLLSSEFLNSDSVIDISSDSTSSEKKDKTSLCFNLSSINKKANDVRLDSVLDSNKLDTDICNDDDASSTECIDGMKKPVEFKSVTSNIFDDSGTNTESIKVSKTPQPDIVSITDSDSSNSKTESILKAELTSKSKIIPSSLKSTDSVPSDIVKTSIKSKLSASKIVSIKSVSSEELLKIETKVRNTRNKTALDDPMNASESKEEEQSSHSEPAGSEVKDVCVVSSEISDACPESVDENKNDDNGSLKNEPITLRIFKDNNALHSESMESPKRSRLDDSPKQLEFTLKISKDASTNIPKATMSPKRTQSPQRLPDPILPRISSEVSITPITLSPPKVDKKTVKRPTRNTKSMDSSSIEQSVEITITKADSLTRIPSITHVNNIPDVVKIDLNNCNNVSDSGESSIIVVKEEVLLKESPVNISTRGGKRGRKDVNQAPGPPRKRGRPPKRRIEDLPTPTEGGAVPSYNSGLVSSEADSTTSGDTPSGRPVRECRDRTRPILVKQRKPRGGGNSASRGRGGGRGGARLPLLPGREALSVREQEELDRIEARNQQIRLEKLAKREAKLAKKAKKMSTSEESPPSPPPRELTEEEKIELAAKREAAQKAAAEAAAIAKAEAERLAQEAAAAKEAEKLAKILARKERLRELHRMKREKLLAKKAAKKLKDEERRKRKAAEKAAEQAAALQSMYEDETRMSAPDGSLRPPYGDDTPNRNKTGRMEINLHESKDVSVEQLAEYHWEGGELFMIQEQVAEYLGVKSFKRKYPDLKRRPVDAEERKYLEDAGLVPKSLCDLGITAVSSAEVLDIMFQDFPNKYEEVRKYLREKQMREISSKQRALSLYSKQSDKAKADLREQAVECASSWNAHLNRERKEERKCSMDLQSFIIHFPLSKRETMKRPTEPPSNYPVAVLPGQFCDFYKRFTSNELMYFPLNTVLYGPLKPNERRLFQSDVSQSESEDSTSSEESSSSSDSDSESEGDEDTKCKICNSSRTSRLDEGGGTNSNVEPPPVNKPEIFLPCSKCKLLCHPSCCKITGVMLPHVRKYNWMCTTCKVCAKCNSADNQSKMRLCDLCDRGFHIACLDPKKMVPEGNRWHCAVCSFCWSCSAKEPGGPSNQWLHEFIKDESGEKVYQRSLCATCCANVGREAAAAVAAAAAAAAAKEAAGGHTSNSFTPGPSFSTVITSGTVTPAIVSNSGTNTPSTPLKGYQVIHTKDGNQVRLAVSRSVGSVIPRSPLAARVATSDTLVLRSPGSTLRLPAAPTDSQLVIRTPTGVITRPPRNILNTPNNRVDVASPSTPLNINGATSNAKK